MSINFQSPICAALPGIFALLTAQILVVGCGIVQALPELSPVQENRTDCESKGGTWGQHGLALEESCKLTTKDSGRECSDSSECEGSCIAELTPEEQELVQQGSVLKSQGKCSPYRHYPGCHAVVKGGLVHGILCSD